MTGQPNLPSATSVERIEPAPVAALAALFDDGLASATLGEPLPALWHWVALPTWFPASETGPDGHQRLGLALPDVGKPRRMFAGGRVELLDDVFVGETVRREIAVGAPEIKSGRQGDFVLVRVDITIHNSRGLLAVRERQDLIYRDAAPTSVDGPSASPEVIPVASSLLAHTGHEWELATDPTKLLRFSAATSNSHRIHYDHQYATQVEGYPGLVVHGPLMTLALAEVLRLQPTAPPRRGSFVHRGLGPLFCGQAARIRQETTAEAVVLTLVSSRGEHSSLRVET